MIPSARLATSSSEPGCSIFRIDPPATDFSEISRSRALRAVREVAYPEELGAETVRLRVGFDVEAFDLHLSVSGASTGCGATG